MTIGKTASLFAGRGVTRDVRAASDEARLDALERFLATPRIWSGSTGASGRSGRA